MAYLKSVLIAPILSEKSSKLTETLNKYVFRVSKSANKLEIKRAVEERFNVKVSNVATINQKGKKKSTTIRSNGRVLRTSGFRSDWKKAIVTLPKDFTIDLVGGEY
ncbi:MAG: 50S ribosomal protein L23 [Candidatus Marinimicrobia bacterium]|jgi:large subunit ribosomal protein L23|nr:50S ribosomal protein L23 [Candidatus Neomarinimicrobiota bacterium]MBT3683105.1 50S ribosomal protein L23 [Candidatus Neomarinimicrobiota bacterium]MBT3759803.1 50S ribosomal protein L23 [Candidatus Neomarinimicrobiota bacterium]MBT3895744.1 50S ribosomal protein L23 [Candidatus Neomarinimicrobiota bacterium]MBT4173217.1 50S ribosomal protein L23 [Candidatus Neomarinimicrobiota bacterium]